MEASVRSVMGQGAGPSLEVTHHEVIVSDSGSTDGTLDLARCLAASLESVKVVTAPPGGLGSRAEACNRGVAAARGDVLLFLDADALLPRGWEAAVRSALADPQVIAGAFHLHLDGPEPALRWVERINHFRYRKSHLFYGDQGVFARAADFDAVGGFPEIPVLESARLCKALKTRGRLALLEGKVSASARRFQAGGVWRVFLGDVVLWARGLLRLGPGAAGRRYWQENRDRAPR